MEGWKHTPIRAELSYCISSAMKNPGLSHHARTMYSVLRKVQYIRRHDRVSLCAKAKQANRVCTNHSVHSVHAWRPKLRVAHWPGDMYYTVSADQTERENKVNQRLR